MSSLPYQVIQNLVPDDPDHLEALLAAHAVHNHVPMYANEVLAVQYAILVLSRCIDDLHCEVMVPIPDDFAEGVLDGRVVGVYEVAVDVLDCEGAFACALVRSCDRVRYYVSSSIPTDLLPTMAILRCFCCGGIFVSRALC